jgi:DNA polymerase-3 subunit delta
MKYTVTQLRQDIDRGQLRPVYFFYGPEEFLKERFIEEILGKLVSPDLKDFNLDILYGDETDATSLIDRVASLPMMAERRLVLVRNVDTMPAEERRKILEYSGNT